MNRLRVHILIAGLIVAILPIIAYGRSSAKQQNNSHTVQAQAASKATPSNGELVFQQNCSRCHNAPQSFPPQISKSIVRHMRVRASLSAADEKALLQLMNP